VDREICATHNLAEKRQERKCGKREKIKCTQQGSRGRTGETLETQGVPNRVEGE
jgi:hypothetical protein